MVNKQIHKQICKVKHTVYYIVACPMEENKAERSQGIPGEIFK